MVSIYATQIMETKTENGADSFASAKDERVGFAFQLVRGLDRQKLQANFGACLNQGQIEGGMKTWGKGLVDSDLAREAARQVAADMCVLAFQTRDIREGKGERQLFHWMMLELYKEWPATSLELCGLIPEYGSWKDVNQLLEVLEAEGEGEAAFADLEARLLQMYVDQLRKDVGAKTSERSLAGKWAPREGHHFNATAKRLASLLFPGAGLRKARTDYRKLVAGLAKSLDVVEVKMCAGEFSAIRPGAVPAKCLKNHRAAFMNEVATGKRKGEARSEDADRVACKDNFLSFIEECKKHPKKAKLHGANLQPHELIQAYEEMPLGVYGGQAVRRTRTAEDPVLEAQWADLVRSFSANEEDQVGALQSMVPLCDVSGSMEGVPMQVAIAMGALISKLNHPAFRGRYMTFHEEPSWQVMGEDWSLQRTVEFMMNDSNWGGSTDFEKAFELVLSTCVQNNLSQEEIPKVLAVFSDMQFNEASMPPRSYFGNRGPVPYFQSTEDQSQFDQASRRGGFEATYETIQRRFKEARCAAAPDGYTAPTILYWNLRAGTNDFPATSDSAGVEMLAGFSPNLLKLFMEGSLDEFVPTPEKPRPTPYDTFRRQLDGERYDRVRAVLEQVQEGPFKGYVAPVTMQEAVVLEVEGAPDPAKA